MADNKRHQCIGGIRIQWLTVSEGWQSLEFSGIKMFFLSVSSAFDGSVFFFLPEGRRKQCTWWDWCMIIFCFQNSLIAWTWSKVSSQPSSRDDQYPIDYSCSLCQLWEFCTLMWCRRVNLPCLSRHKETWMIRSILDILWCQQSIWRFI